MLLYDDKNRTMILNSIHTPTDIDYFWVLDLQLMDFTLTKLYMLEETTCPSVQVEMYGFKFFVPSSWVVLIFSQETQQLDLIDFGQLAATSLKIAVSGRNVLNIRPGILKVLDYVPTFKNIAPSLAKHQMLCHPVSEQYWISIFPSDQYNKYLKDKIVGDLIG